jgi:hypothetical protein
MADLTSCSVSTDVKGHQPGEVVVLSAVLASLRAGVVDERTLRAVFAT